MYSRSGSGIGARFENKTHYQPTPQRPLEEIYEDPGVCVSCINPVKFVGESNPPTFMRVDADKKVHQLSRTQNHFFDRFVPSTAPTEEAVLTLEPSVSTVVVSSAPPLASTDQVLPVPPLPVVPDPVEIQRLIDAEVEKRLRAVEKPPVVEAPIPQVLTAVPFFNHELYATNDCESKLEGGTLTMVVELAGLLEQDPQIYPFGTTEVSLKFPDQQLMFTWSNDNETGRAMGSFYRQGGDYVIDLLSIELSSGEIISFTEVELPVTFKYKGPLPSF